MADWAWSKLGEPKRHQGSGANLKLGQNLPAASRVLDHLALTALLFCDAPAQVHIHNFHASLTGLAAQVWEHLLDQQVALLNEVPEGAQEEDAYLALASAVVSGVGLIGVSHGREQV